MKTYHRSILLLLCVVLTALIGPATVAGETAEQPASQPLFSVKTLVIAESVEAREPVGVAESFPAPTEKVYGFLEASDISEDTEVTFVWHHADSEVSRFSLQVHKGPRWRTYAYKNLYGMTGAWKLEIKDSSGNTIDSKSFTVD